MKHDKETMENYTKRLKDYMDEELQQYDSGITDEWNDARKKSAEVLGYKLSGTSDVREDFSYGGPSHFNRELEKWSKKYGYKFDYKHKKVRGKTKAYFVINVDLETFNKNSKAVIALNGLTIQFGADYRPTGKTLTVETKKRDYKAEYKKFQSSTKSKKYRAELNKYNRQKGTYGNGDGKDASHKGGKIVGFEAQSKNRGRAEKSRLRKEISTADRHQKKIAIDTLKNPFKGKFLGGMTAKEAEKVLRDKFKYTNKQISKLKESINEGKWSKIMTSVRKGSKAGPWSIVVYKNKKVLHQRLVKILQQIPAQYEDVKKKFPNASIGIEDKYGERVYTESINESSFQKGKKYGGTSGLGGVYMGQKGLSKLKKVTKDNPNNTFLFKDDNHTGLKTHWIKNGKIAKYTVENPNYDFAKNMVRNFKVKNDVILSFKLFEGKLNEGNIPKNIKLSKQGYVKQIKHPMTGKIMKSVKVNGKEYRYNSVYKTYNSVRGNQLLYKNDADNIRYESINEAKELYKVVGIDSYLNKVVDISMELPKAKAKSLLKTILKQQKDSGMDIFTKLEVVPIKESINEGKWAVQHKKNKRYLSSKSLQDKTPHEFKSEKEARNMLVGIDWRFRGNYKVVKLKESIESKLRNMIREEIQLFTESTEFIVFYNRKQHKVKAKDLYTAKKEFISKNKVPMSKWGRLAIMSKKAYDDQQFRYESINEGKKKFRVNPHAIGKAKYSIDFHDGKSKHKDGSPFWGINIFKNKKDLEKAIKDYTKKGYIKESINEGKEIYKVYFSDGNTIKITSDKGEDGAREFVKKIQGGRAGALSGAMHWAKNLKIKKIVKESINEANPSQIKKKLLKQFGKDPLYKDVIMAKNTKEMKKAMDTLKSIRGGNALVLMQKYAKKITGESINEGKYDKELLTYLKKHQNDKYAPTQADLYGAVFGIGPDSRGANSKELKALIRTTKQLEKQGKIIDIGGAGRYRLAIGKYKKESINEAGKSETKTFKISGEVMKNTKVYYPGFNTTVKTPVVNYKIRNFQEPISKKMLLHIKKELGGDYILKTNAGVELHSKELRNNTWKGIKVLRMESINEATEYYKSKKKNEDLYYKKVGNKWYKSMASKKGKVKWYTVKFPQDLDMKDMDKLNKSKIPSELVESKLNEAKESPIDIAKRVVKNKQREKGLDLTTANYIIQVYDKLNPKNKKKIEKLPLKKLVDLVWKLPGY